VVLLDADPQRSLTVWHGNDGKLKELELHTDATEKAAKWASEASKRAIVVAGYRWLCFDHSSRRPEDLGRSTDPLSCKRP